MQKQESENTWVQIMKKIREWISVKVVKSPRLIVLLCVLTANIIFIGAAALVISWLSPEFPEDGGIVNSILNTIIMYLGIGGIDTVIEDISQADMLLVLSSIVIVVIGLVFFTYALIGYMSDFISDFIGNADSSSKKLRISDHIVLLNWNTRAAEIINDLLYKNTKEKIVILSADSREDIMQDIDERTAVTVKEENDAVRKAGAAMGFRERRNYRRKNKIRNKLTVIVREGNTSSAKQLEGISIKEAKSIIILSAGGSEDSADSHTIKTLIQAAQMTGAENADLNQQIVVETEDEQTLELAKKIIRHKMKNDKCSIVPISVNRILGYIFSQFSIMPELNLAYSALFSYKGADLYALPSEGSQPDSTEFVSVFLNEHLRAVPLALMQGEDGKRSSYYLADCEQDIRIRQHPESNSDYTVSLNPAYEIDERHIIILGHNGKNQAMMEGFAAFNSEWKRKDGSDALSVTIIDDEESLEKQDYYEQYSWVRKVVKAEIYEQDTICSAVSEFIDTRSKGGCIMILSDDAVPEEEIDENALIYLVLVQDIIISRAEADQDFRQNDIDMIVEIVDPRNHDIVNNYNMKNIVISNRYVSKMIMQVGENKALFDFYQDILTYDNADETEESSKELYIKRADMFFNEIPQPCTAAELIRAVYDASPDSNKSVMLGYFRPDGEMVLFSGDQTKISTALDGQEKLILFSNH